MVSWVHTYMPSRILFRPSFPLTLRGLTTTSLRLPTTDIVFFQEVRRPTLFYGYTSMYLSYIFIWFLSHKAVALAAVLQPRASPSPCTYTTCPDSIYGPPSTFFNPTTQLLYCDYSLVRCVYNARDGSFYREGTDPHHFCPRQAVGSPNGCSPTRKRGVNEAREVARKHGAPARAKLPAEVENTLRGRAYLGKQKLKNKKA